MSSIGSRFAAVVVGTTVVIGAAGFLAGQGVLERVAALAEDKGVTEALTDERKALLDGHKLRRASAEALIANCRDAGRVAACTVPDVTIAWEELAEDDPGAVPRWEGEKAYVFRDGKKLVRARFDWDEMKPRFEAVSEVIGRREHLSLLLPELTRSFLVALGLALFGAAILGLFGIWLLSRRIAARVSALVDYTRRIAVGELAEAPPLTRGTDEVGMLARALERMAEDLDQARQRLVLTEKMQSWQNVARKVAHEIKNPLTPISLVAAELKRRGAAATGETASFLEEAGRVLYEETSSLERMVREFTAFARLPEPRLEAGDLEDLVRDFAQRNLVINGPKFTMGGEPGPYPVVLDRAMIAQILHNLVNNARLAKAPQAVEVGFRLRREADGAVVDVMDDAGGVPETLRETLFDAYVTTRSTGDGEKGMGLGLAIARKIAMDHGGSLDLTSTGGKGSVFTLRLPLHALPRGAPDAGVS